MRVILPVVAVLSLSGTAAAVQPTVPDLNVRPFVAHEIDPKVHLLTTPADYYGPAVGNVILIEQSNGFVIVDSGLDAANGRAVVRYARSLSPKPIKAVMITHWHNDHPQGISAIRDAYPKVRIIATRGTEAGMLGPEAFDVGYAPGPEWDEATAKLVERNKEDYRKLLEDPSTAPDRRERIKKALGQLDEIKENFKGTYIVPPTETFERELVIDDREVPVRMLFLGRANTEGDALAWLPKQKILASGDIVVSPIPFGFGSYPGNWVETLGKIKQLGFTTLIPGHGMPMSDGSYLDKLVASIKDIQVQVAPLAKAGMSLDDVKKKVDFSKSIALFGDSPRVRANAQSLFFEPMVSNAYKEARGEPIIQGEGSPPPDVPPDKAPPSRAIRHKS